MSRRTSQRAWELGTSAELRVHLAEYGRGLRKYGFAVIVAGIGGVLGLIALVVPPPAPTQANPHPGPLVSPWLWATLLFGGLILAQFRFWRDTARERDSAKYEMGRRFDSLRYRFVLDRLDGRPTTIHQPDGSGGVASQPGYTFVFRFFNGGVEALEYEVESIRISLAGHTTPDAMDSLSSLGGLILPGREAAFFYPVIYAPTSPLLQGEAEYTIVYGHPSGGRRFRTHHKLGIGWEWGPDGTTGVVWVTVGTVSHDAVDD